MRYFAGTSVMNGRVRLVAAKTFRELVESQVFVPVIFPMKRAELLAHPDRDKLKDGAFLCAATYPTEDAIRNDEGADGFTMVIVDLDGPEARDFAQAPDTIRDALSPLNFAAWTTAKHTPEQPRIKIMVDCLTSDKTLFKRTARHIIKMLGLPENFKGSPESKVLSQPQYRPLHYQGEEYSAVIASRLDGKPFDPSTVPDEETPAEERYAYQMAEGEPDVGDILSLPMQGISVDDILEPLNAIDPDCDYRKWYEVAAALRHNFTDEDDARRAFEAYDEWSSGGTKYKGAEDVLCKWRSFRPYPEGRSPITLRTLFHHAMHAGWRPEKLSKRLSEEFKTWCSNAAEPDLMGEGVRKIAMSPVRSEMGDEMMAEHIVEAMKRYGHKISRQSVLKDVRNQRRQDKLENAKTENPPWMLPFCFIGPQDRFRNTVTGSEYSVDAFNHTFGRYMINEAEPPADGRATVTPANYALNIAKLKVVEGCLYDPRQESGQEPYFEQRGLWYVNTFLASSVPAPTPIGATRAGNLIKTLLQVNLANDEYERIVLDWMAFCVQKPGVKIRWAILLQGGQGCGKGTLVDTLEAAIGRGNLKKISGNILTGTFDDWRQGAHVIYVDELFSAGANRHEVNNKLKDAITNDIVPVNQKFRDVVNIPNVSNYFLTTNKHDSLVLEDSDRRYMVLKSKLQNKDQIMAFTEEGVMARIHELVKESPGSFRHFFLHHEISKDFHPSGHAPETIYRRELVEQGKNVVQLAIEDMIDDPAHPLIAGDVVHYAYLERALSALTKNSHRPSHYLSNLGFRAYAEGQTLIVSGERTKVYIHTERFLEGLDDPVEILEERSAALME